MPLLPHGWVRDPMDTPPLALVCATATAGFGSKVILPGDLFCRGIFLLCYRRGGRGPMDHHPLAPVSATATASFGSKVHRLGD